MKTINRLSALYVICWVFYPFMQVALIYRYIAVAFGLIWILTALLQSTGFIKKYKVFFICSLSYVFLLVAIRLVFGLSVSDSIARTLQTIIMILIGVMSIYYHENDFDFFKILFPILMISLIFFSITTIIGLIENPYASRIANSEWLENRFAGHELTGLYGYIYLCVFTMPVILFMMLKKIRINKITTFLTVVAFIIMFIMVIMSGYMIAIFCCIGSCVAIIAFHKYNALKAVILISLVVLFIVFYRYIVDGFFSLLMQFTKDNPVYYNKFSDFRDLFLGSGVVGETVESRTSNYYASFLEILRYPFLGSYLFGISLGGGHSSILDTFGKFGIICGLLFIYLFLIFPHKIGKRNRKYQLLDYAFLLFSLIFYSFDPIVQECSISLFIVYPFISSLYYKQCTDCRQERGETS